MADVEIGPVEEPWARTIHIGVPEEATEAERELLEDMIAAVAYNMKRGTWDPLVWSHDGECETSSHCCGPR